MSKALLESTGVPNLRLNVDDCGDGSATIMVELFHTNKRLLSVSLEREFPDFISLGQDHHPSLRFPFSALTNSPCGASSL
jgi:hypothetical protein